MAKIPESVAEFLMGKRIAVAGVSRDTRQVANAILRRLRHTGHEVIPVNPNATLLEGVPCYPDLASIPGTVDGLLVAAHPSVASNLVDQCSKNGIRHIWFHRGFGVGSVSDEAVREAQTLGLTCVVGGCPLMYCEPVDPFHRCMRGWLHWRHRAP
jgi:predicted CoA-binding protein